MTHSFLKFALAKERTQDILVIFHFFFLALPLGYGSSLSFLIEALHLVKKEFILTNKTQNFD
jgi:hypothetical protein